MSINPLPFARLTVLAGVVILLTGFAMGIVDRDAGTPAAASAQSVGELGGLVYQVPEARALDPGNPVDAGILHGIPVARGALPAGQEWYGVFLTVQNPGRRARLAARSLVLVDVEGHRFGPEQPLGSNVYAYRLGRLGPGQVYPPAISPAAENLTAQGALLLFRIPRASQAAGPLELRIHPPAGHGQPQDLPVS